MTACVYIKKFFFFFFINFCMDFKQLKNPMRGGCPASGFKFIDSFFTVARASGRTFCRTGPPKAIDPRRRQINLYRDFHPKHA